MSAYLNEPGRLGDVIAAIQAMATYKYYKLTFDGWADRISADRERAAHWQRVFEEHPEFFRLDSDRTRASLVWRRQYPRRYNVDEERTLTVAELAQLPAATRANRISRSPLSAADIGTLVRTGGRPARAGPGGAPGFPVVDSGRGHHRQLRRRGAGSSVQGIDPRCHPSIGAGRPTSSDGLSAPATGPACSPIHRADVR
jgi:hypothetical protein